MAIVRKVPPPASRIAPTEGSAVAPLKPPAAARSAAVEPEACGSAGSSATRLPNRDLHIVYRNLADLRAPQRQTRTHSAKQAAKLDHAIRTFGFVAPIIVDPRGEILDGVARWEAAKRLGLDRVPTVVVQDASPAQLKLLRLALNRIAEDAGWDAELLRLEFEELRLDETLDLEASGFEMVEIEGLVVRLQDEPDHPPPSVQQSAISRIGDVWRLGEHRLICADARDAAAWKQALGGARAAAIFADPPYNVPITHHVRTTGDSREFVMGSGEMSQADFTALLTSWMEAAKHNARAGAVVYVCADWRHLDEFSAAGRAARCDLLNLCVWAKDAAGMGSFYRSQHELVFVWRLPGARHVNRVQLGKHGRNRSNVWRYPGLNAGGAERSTLLAMHPTIKPIALVADALLDCTEPGEWVVDPFGGSGTTLLAAERIKRRAALIELDPLYCDVILRRWIAETGQTAIREADGADFLALEQSHARTPSTGPDGPDDANSAMATPPPRRVRPRPTPLPATQPQPQTHTVEAAS